MEFYLWKIGFIVKIKKVKFKSHPVSQSLKDGCWRISVSCVLHVRYKWRCSVSSGPSTFKRRNVISSYRAVNTFHHGYKSQSVNDA